jgi:hypothetical protein
MTGKNCNNSKKEGASETNSFGFERGPWETLETHQKQIVFFILTVFRKGLRKPRRSSDERVTEFPF